MNKEKTLVFSIALGGYSQLFKKCISSQRRYCEKFGLDYVLVDKSPRSLLPIEAAWLKIFLLKEVLSSGNYKWIAFIDADCEIREFAPLFTSDLKLYNESKSVFMAHGFSGRINSGVIFLKNTPEALFYLTNVINHKDSPIPKEDQALYENGHMIHFSKDNPIVQIIEFKKWNNNQNINTESFIQHYSGGMLREQYLRKNPIRTFVYKAVKKIKRYIFKSPSSTSTPRSSINQIDSLVPFYLKTFTSFNSKN